MAAPLDAAALADANTTILYTLSTLAQTCAALAAFVGAVGIFRLQHLRARRNASDRAARRLARLAGIYGPSVITEPRANLIADVRRARDETQPSNKYYERVQGASRAVDSLVAFGESLRRSRRTLIVFESWNLLLVGLSLIGFNYVPALARCPATFWAVWLSAVVTVAVTIRCVYVWTWE